MIPTHIRPNNNNIEEAIRLLGQNLRRAYDLTAYNDLAARRHHYRRAAPRRRQPAYTVVSPIRPPAYLTVGPRRTDGRTDGQTDAVRPTTN